MTRGYEEERNRRIRQCPLCCCWKCFEDYGHPSQWLDREIYMLLYPEEIRRNHRENLLAEYMITSTPTPMDAGVTHYPDDYPLLE